LPTENSLTNVVKGVITDSRGLVVTTAKPGARGPGGIREVQIPDASKQVRIISDKPFKP
jgi:hypothetical protein